MLSPLIVAQPLLANVMVSPAAVTGTDLGTYDSTVPLVHMIDQSGIETPFVSGSTDFDAYFAPPNKAYGLIGTDTGWQSDYTFDLPLIGYVDFDLGAPYEIDKFTVWNLSLKDVTLALSLETNGAVQTVGPFVLTNHLSYFRQYPPDVVSLGGSYTARYVRLQIQSTYLYPPPNDIFAYAIVGEVVFSAKPLSAGTGPVLQIHQAEPGNATISWKPVTPGFKLQITSSLETPDWTDAPSGTNNPTIVPAGSSAAFYRLLKTP